MLLFTIIFVLLFVEGIYLIQHTHIPINKNFSLFLYDAKSKYRLTPPLTFHYLGVMMYVWFLLIISPPQTKWVNYNIYTSSFFVLLFSSFSTIH